MTVAIITAVHETHGTVKEQEAADHAEFSTLLQYGEEIIVHEVVDHDDFEKLQATHPDEWWDIVEFDDSTSGDDSETDDGEISVEMDADSELATPDVGEPGQCLDSTCNDDADVSVRVNTGQIRHYCDSCRQSADLGGRMLVDAEARLRQEG